VAMDGPMQGRDLIDELGVVRPIGNRRLGGGDVPASPVFRPVIATCDTA
jgi:hypothetical protein